MSVEYKTLNLNSTNLFQNREKEATKVVRLLTIQMRQYVRTYVKHHWRKQKFCNGESGIRRIGKSIDKLCRENKVIMKASNVES